MDKRTDKSMDSQMLFLTILLLLIGIVMLFTASYAQAYEESGNPYYYVIKQGQFACVGLVIMYFVSRIEYKWMHVCAIPTYVVSIILLILVILMGEKLNEAQRWIKIAGIQFQPSEIAKTAIILLFSSMAVKRQKYEKEFLRGFLPYVILLGTISVLTVLQPHISATIIIAGTGIMIAYIGGVNAIYVAGLIVAGIAGVCGVIFMNDYAMTRVKVWIDPFSDFLNKGWQGSQSFITIGSGGLFGLGFGQGRQKHLYLPEPANDFIFPVICEELGFIGAMMIILLFAIFIFRGFVIAVNAKDKFGTLLASGIIIKIAIQTIINLFVVTGLFPVTGASLPFFSYGGTALIIQFAEIGILLNISRYGKKVN